MNYIEIAEGMKEIGLNLVQEDEDNFLILTYKDSKFVPEVIKIFKDKKGFFCVRFSSYIVLTEEELIMITTFVKTINKIPLVNLN